MNVNTSRFPLPSSDHISGKLLVLGSQRRKNPYYIGITKGATQLDGLDQQSGAAARRFLRRFGARTRDHVDHLHCRNADKPMGLIGFGLIFGSDLIFGLMFTVIFESNILV